MMQTSHAAFSLSIPLFSTKSGRYIKGTKKPEIKITNDFNGKINTRQL